MGDGKVLTNFVKWAKDGFPAKRYALIVWDHGQGYRGVIPPTKEVLALIAGAKSNQPGTRSPAEDVTVAFPFKSGLGSPLRTASNDETDKDKLYNAETKQALQEALNGQKLNVLGYDACLMAMVETGYAMREVADVLVGSEDLEPGAGWQYDDWLKILANTPAMDGPALGKVLVDSYKNRYATPAGLSVPQPELETLPDTTQSAIDLSKMEGLADAITVLAKSMMGKFAAENQNIKAARDSCKMFAPDPLRDGRDYFFHIDMARFCEQLMARTQDPELKAQAKAVRDLILTSVLRSYAGAERQGDYGSNGLAIYFPPNNSTYKGDLFAERGYENSRTLLPGESLPIFPVEFVQKHYWADFLHVYFARFE
jgi:hypothetical protein